MLVSIATMGSRGDVQPFLALAVALMRAGHRVRMATCDPFCGLVSDHGVEFVSLGGDIKEIVGDRGRAALMAAGTNPIRTVRALRTYVGPLVREGLARLPDALEGSDVIIGQLLAPGAVHYAEARGLPYFEASYDPTVPTRAFAHPGAPPTTPPGVASWLTYVAAEQVFWQAFRPDVDAFRRGTLGLGRAPVLGPTIFPLSRRPPTLLGYSREILPRPTGWPDTVTVTGAWCLGTPPSFRPPAELTAFLSAGPPPVYVGFGSMTVDRPEATTRIVLDALRRTGQRAVLSTGWGGLATAHRDDILVIGDVPHSWLFPRMSAVVHHGGPGTTAEALRAGVPQLVVPFLSDQPFWGHHVARAGVGPDAIPINELNADRLSDGLAAMTVGEMRSRAARVGERVRSERGADEAVAAIHRHLERRGPGRGRPRAARDDSMLAGSVTS